jgi:hypothetical protein
MKSGKRELVIVDEKRAADFIRKGYINTRSKMLPLLAFYNPEMLPRQQDKDLTKILSTDTLYVPKSVLMSFNALTANEKEKKENIFDGYRYKYRICTDEELFDVFQISKKGRLLFEYVKSSTDKFITIYDLQQKRVVYRNYVALSYNLKSKDISRIK